MTLSEVQNLTATLPIESVLDVFDNSYVITLPRTEENVLSPELCDNYTNVFINLQEKLSDINDELFDCLPPIGIDNSYKFEGEPDVMFLDVIRRVNYFINELIDDIIINNEDEFLDDLDCIVDELFETIHLSEYDEKFDEYMKDNYDFSLVGLFEYFVDFLETHYQNLQNS